MSALAKMVGLACVRCALKGHRCQAQMMESGSKPLCLRCANDEPCCYETAEAMETPRRYEDDRFDLYVVPQIVERSVPARRHRVEIVKPQLSYAEIYQIRREIARSGVEEAARRHGLEPCMIEDLKPTSVDEEAVRREKDRAERAALKQRVKQKVRKRMMRRIGGELVRLAPGAQMGAEFVRTEPTSAAAPEGTMKPAQPVAVDKSDLKLVEKRVRIQGALEQIAGYWGTTVDELRKVGSGNNGAAQRRAVAMAVLKEACGASRRQIADEFRVVECQVSASGYILKARPGLREIVNCLIVQITQTTKLPANMLQQG